ncbi:MAG: winged helix-turn-helix domain-containing protein [Acidobacteria bacterium]|nr:winged helix-turn-helix domain-containing protein [Acidobacteriota bacterium]
MAEEPVNKGEYSFGEFRVDVPKRLLFSGTERIPLTPKVFDTLLVFLERPNQVLEKDTLMELLWADSFVEEANLAQNVAVLRKALGDGKGDNRFIVTVPGRGYRFVAEVSVGKGPLPAGKEVSRQEKAGLFDRLRTLRWVMIASVTIIVLLTGWYTYRSGFAKSGPPRSIAVFPLKNQTGNPENDYLGAGISEGLMTKLSHVQGLKVVARDSAFSLDGTDPLEAGRKLNVSAVLIGSIRGDGKTLRIDTRLVDTSDGSVIVADETGDRPVAEIFQLEDEISRKTLAAFRLSLASGAEKRPPANPEAYALFLRGNYHLDKWTARDAQLAADYYSQAVAIDPSFARAYNGLADAYYVLNGIGAARPADVMPKARDAVDKALALEPDMAEAHATLGEILDTYDFDFAGADREFQRAVELDPDSSQVHYLYGKFLPDIRNEFGESKRQFRLALDLDPYSAAINKDYGEILFYAHEFDAALEQNRHALEIEPTNPTLHSWNARIYARMGDHDSSIDEYMTARKLLGRHTPEQLEAMRQLYKTKGWNEFWLGEIKHLQEQPAFEPYFLVWDYEYIGDHEHAMEWLYKAYESKSSWMGVLKYDPLIDGLRQDPRFKELVVKVFNKA